MKTARISYFSRREDQTMMRSTKRLNAFSRMAVFAGLLVTACPAWAEWTFGGGEGIYYAYETDGGFINGSYENGLMFSCPDDGRGYCNFYVTIDGRMPESRDIVTFAFANGTVITAIAESVNGARPEIGYTDELLQMLKSQDAVRVSLATGQNYTFSLSGSARAHAQALNP